MGFSGGIKQKKKEKKKMGVDYFGALLAQT
jgi:hypothetical protein